MSGDRERVVSRSRVRYRVLLAVVIGCYVATVIVVMYLFAGELGPAVLIPLWSGHAVLLMVLIRKLRIAALSSAYTALFIVCTSVMSVYVAGMARENVVLQQRGEKATVTVSKEWLDPAQGRKARNSHYQLKHQDGSPVPGPEMLTTSDLYDVGEVLTVMEDPDGELRPRTLGEADATGELLGSGALALASLGAVGWMTWRGSDMATRREESKPSAGVRMYKTVTRDHTTREEQEEKLRDALEAGPADRRGYVKVHPEDYPDVSHHRAARIAWEMGLRAEATGNKGSWRFGETVIEEVPHD